MKNFIIIFFLSIFCISCFNNKNKKIEIIPTAKVDTVKMDGNNNDKVFPATLKVSSEINLSFRVAGQIQNFYVKEGDFVRRGQVVSQIDMRDYQTQVSATRAEYNEIKSLTDRVTELYNRGSATKNDYEKAIYGLQQITAKLNHHENQLADTRLLATSDGFVQKLIHNEGEIIAAGMPVITISAGKELAVVLNLPASDYINKNNFDRYYAVLSSYKNVKIPLELSEISAKGTTGQSFEMTLKLPKKADTLKLAAGVAAEVHIIYKHIENQYIEIPISAIFEENDSTFVWIFTSENDVLRKQFIKVFDFTENGTALITNGLNQGDMFVSAGIHSIKNGMKVKALK